MLKHIIPLFLLIFSVNQAFAQMPQKLKGAGITPTDRSMMVCPMGATPDAGTSTQSIDQAIFPTNQSNNIQFLCLGDSMQVTHMGGDLSGDPIGITTPGFSYIFYRCPPSAAFSGPDLNTILLDPCHYLPAPAPDLVTIQPPTTPITPDGNATFFNDGGLQNLPENMGEPTSIWFAPFTVDQFEQIGGSWAVNYENGGPCMDVNTDDAFNVVYLNEITISNLDNNAGGNGCQGQMTLSGGLSEFLIINGNGGGAADDYTVTISQVGNPSVTGFVPGGWEHGETNNFRVPEPGTYLIEIEDGVSCGASTTVVMGSCETIDFTIGDSLAEVGENICMPITVANFTDIFNFEFFLEWDNTVLNYTGTTPGDLDLTVFNVSNNQPNGPGSAFFSWIEPTFGSSLVTLNDGDVIFNVCFDVIGTPGQSSPITFGDFDFEVGTANALVGSPTFDDGSITIIVPSNMTLDFSTCSSLSGAMADVGSITITVIGGTPNYTYSYTETTTGATGGGMFMAGANMVEITNLPPGTYSITVTDDTGANETSIVTIADANPLVVAIDASATSDPTCDGVMDGMISINVAGGIAPVNIAWSTGPMNVNSINGLGTGNYSVSATDANGCVKVAATGLITPDPITIDTLIQHVSCSSPTLDDGAITITPMGGPSSTTSYSFIWDNSLGTNATVNNLMPGTYCVTVTANVPPPDVSCDNIFCIEILSPNPPVIDNFLETPISCPGANDGAITVNVTQGNGNITSIDWTDSSGGTYNGATITGLVADTYTVTVTADDGCTATDSYVLAEPMGIEVMLDSVPPTCSYTNNGRATATVSGGSGTYTYNWSNGGTSSLIFDLACGQFYTVTVSDGGACPEVVDSIFLPCPPDILITFDPNSIVPVSCNGLDQPLCDGSVTVTASAGTTMSGDYNFQWDNSPDAQMGGSVHTATQLCQGWNYVTVSDADCFFVDSVFIPAPPELMLNPDSTDIVPVSCNGGMDGSIFVAAQGGTPEYTYNWDNGDSGQTISGLTAGSYVVSVTDLNTCLHVINVEVDEPDILMAFVNPDNTTDASCNGSEDGQIEIAWTGGNIGDPTTYSWSPAVSTSSIATDLAPGLYTVTVTDRKGCTDEVSHVIANPPPINFTLNPVDEPPCFGETTVITIASASGGSGLPYQFSVGGAKREIDQAIRVLAGEVTVTVFDSDNCSEDTTITVTQPPEILVNLGQDLEEIDLGASTVIDANISPPGLQLESLIWTPDNNLECIDFIGNDTTLCTEVEVSPLNTTTYTLTATDLNGCEGSSSITIEVDKNRNIFIPNVFSPNADGFNDEFRVYGGVGVDQVNFMRVFDRWGELVYEADNFQPIEGSDQFWDGRFNGKQMNPGVYVYMIEVSFIDNTTLLYRGDVTILY